MNFKNFQLPDILKRYFGKEEPHGKSATKSKPEVDDDFKL